MDTGISNAAFGAGFPWGSLVSFDSRQTLGSWDPCWALLALWPRSALLPGGPHEATLAAVALQPGDTLRALLAPRSGLAKLPWGTGDTGVAPRTRFTLVTRATFAARLARQALRK